MDFFSAAVDPTTHPVSVDNSSTNNATFAQAVADRFGQSVVLAPRLSPTLPPPPDSSMATMSLKQTAFTPVAPADLPSWLNDPAALIVDIRPHAAHFSARIPKSISLCVPSTLLKRPAFSLQKLSAMLPSTSVRNRFATWPSASRIIVYDADSQSESSNIAGLLKKFKADGFQGDLAWLKGGFQALWKERRALVDTNRPPQELDPDEEEPEPSKSSNHTVLRTRHLPMSAFSTSSTTLNISATNNPFSPHQLATTPNKASNPFFDVVRQNVELAHGITDRIPLALPRRVRSRINDLPFPWLQNIARRASHAPRHHRHQLSIDDSTSTSDGSESPDDPGVVEEGKEALAMQFYKVELAEQRRLMGVMHHHSKETGQNLEPSFPYSITAGVEKGAKNRYRHIWPFEHARVRLHQEKPSDDDYINASYVQPLSTTRRYIATQGPLPATFTDFWTLVWEQNVHVIVMLTREVEGAMVKCASYWTDTEFGPLRLRLVGTEGLPPTEDAQQPRTAHPGFFNEAIESSRHLKKPYSAGPNNHKHLQYSTPRSSTVKRTFELSHTSYPQVPPRKVIHLQYLEWPDMNVPDDARGVLGLVKRVQDAVGETSASSHASFIGRSATAPTSINSTAPTSSTKIDPTTGIALQAYNPLYGPADPSNEPPVLLHCSAGVGRTGGFMVVDAILDGVRREVREMLKKKKKQDSLDKDDMDVDKQTVQERDADNMQVDKVDKENLELNARNERDRDLAEAGMLVDAKQNEKQTSWEIKEQRKAIDFTMKDAGTMKWVESVRDELDSLDVRSSSVTSPVRPNSKTESLAGTATTATTNTSSSNFFSTDPSASNFSSLGTSISPSDSPSPKEDKPPVNVPFPSFVGRDMRKANSNPNPRGQESINNTNNNNILGDRMVASPLPANTPAGTSFPSASSGDLLQAVLQQQLISEQRRMRTVSAPAQGSGVGSKRPPGPSGLATPFKLKLPGPSTSSEAVLSKPTSGVFSSEGEQPSRSQSPSDETSSSNAGWAVSTASRGKNKLKLQLQQPKSVSPVPKISISASNGHNGAAAMAAAAVGSGGVDNDLHDDKAFDYHEPRRLHEVSTPSLLSSMEDPIWEVVLDIREQRMSLCQSLRQYVFVHAAIIEGALMVLDEEKEIADGLGPRNVLHHTYHQAHDYEPDARHAYWPPDSAASGMLTAMGLPDSGGTASYGGRTSPTPSSSGRSSRSTSRSSRRHAPYTNVSSGNGKRASSPTELLKENKEGGMIMPKRPSIKRKQMSGEPESGFTKEEVARYHPVPVRVTSSVMAMKGVSAPSEAAGREVV